MARENWRGGGGGVGKLQKGCYKNRTIIQFFTEYFEVAVRWSNFRGMECLNNYISNLDAS